MVSQQIINILIKAENQADEQFKKVKDQVEKIGGAGKNAFNTVSQTSEKTNQKMGQLSNKLDKTVETVNKVGNQGSESFKKLSQSEQDAVIKFNTLDKNVQTTLQAIREVGSTDMFPDSAKALSSFSQLDNLTKSWSGSMDYAKSKMQLLGNDTDTLKGKFSIIGDAIQSYIGTKLDSVVSKFSSFKNKITETGSVVKSILVNAFRSVEEKANNLSNSFSSLSGMIAQGLGVIGVSSIAELTVGLSLGRESMKALMSATTGSAEATNKLINGGEKLGVTFRNLDGQMTNVYDGLDEITNRGLVSLDDLGQAMSNFKMSTGATNDEMAKASYVIADIGNRAILMGKGSGEALTLMEGAAAGLNGNFMTLHHNFGVTQEKLEDLGWSGAADDVDGYTDALQKYLEQSGKMDEMMNTTTGHLETLKKHFRIAGRNVGDMFTPFIDQAAQALNGLYDNCPKVFEGLIGIAGGISGFVSIAPMLGPTLTSFDSLATKSLRAAKFIGILSAEEDAATLASTLNAAAIKLKTIGMEEEEAAAVADSMANMGLAQSFWALNAAILANPLTWVVVALVAVAVAVYEVGKSFGWWKDVSTMLEAVWAGIQRLWAAFINNPHVKEFIKELGEAWDDVCVALQPVISWAQKLWNELFPPGTNFDIVRWLIDYFGMWADVIARVVGAVITVQKAFSTFIGYLAIVTSPVLGVYEVLKRIVCILLGCSPGIVPALEKVQEVFVTVWTWINSFISGIVSNVVSGIQPVLDVLTSIGNFLLTTFQYAWTTIIMVFAIVSTSINRIIMIFNLLLSGQMSLSTALAMIWQTIRAMFVAVLGTIITRVGIFAKSLIMKALAAGRGFVYGILNYVSNLPGQIAAYLLNIVGRIISAGAQWVSNARSQASSMVSNVISQVSQLPGKIYNEFLNIGSRIMQAGGQLVEKAKEIGKNIVKGLLNSMGIHSPGIIQTKVVTEFEDMTNRMEEQIKPASEIASTFGDSIVDSFGNPSLTTNSDKLFNDLDAPSMSVGIDQNSLGNVNDSNSEVINSFDNLATTTGTSLQSMVDKDKLAYDKIRTNDSNQLSAITSNLQSKMNTMTSKVKSSMDTMINKNKTGLTSANNTTKNQLNSITTATVKANTKMIASWDTMKKGIVSAADKIKTDSTKHFSKLEKTIGSFYRKLQNPGGFGAGPGNGRVSTVKRVGGTNGFKKIANVMRQYSMPQYMNLGEIRRNPLISTANIGSYITPGKNNKFAVNDLIRSGNIRIPLGLEDPTNTGAGSWTSGVSKHVKKIKDVSKDWRMKGPKIIGKYQTSTGFKVSDFINGTPKINYSTFKQMAEDVFSQCHYEFYYDSNKYGNWMTAFKHGGMNCSDSSDALIAMAHACGLSAHKVHGHWNQYGHFWANVAGHKMDTTGWMQRRNWTPAASHAGPAPKTWSLEDLFEELKDSQQEVVVESNDYSNGLVLDGEVTVKHLHEFINLPDTVSAKEVAKLINDSTNEDSWIKNLVQNNVFQKWDLKEKARIEGKTRRARGI